MSWWLLYTHTLCGLMASKQEDISRVNRGTIKGITNSTICHDRGFILRILFKHIVDFGALLAPELLSYPEEKVDLADVLHGINHAAASRVKMHFLGTTQLL